MVADCCSRPADPARHWPRDTRHERHRARCHLIVGRSDEHGADPRFRLTPLGAGAYGLSLYRNQRWEPLPYEGTLQELAVTMNTDLSARADDWS